MTADGSGRGGSGSIDFSRRRLLAGLGSIGAISAASGAGTFAYLADEETLPRNEISAGEVELDVSCTDSNGGNCTVSNGTVSYTPESPIDRGDFGYVTFDVSVRTNPARLWFATTCPPTRDPLGNALEVSLYIGGDEEFSGSLSELRREFAGGLRIDNLDDDACLEPDGDGIEIELTWELPEDATADAAGQTTAFEFQLYTEQCRHVSEEDAAGSNPFADQVCEESGDDCPECVKFGKAEFGDSPVAVGDTFSLIELPAGADGHEIEITGVETKDEEGNAETVGVEFTLQDDDGNPGPDMCKVEIKGGQGTKPYEIDPVSSETDEILFAPLKPDKDKRHGISNIVVFVCSDSGDGDDPDEDETVDCVVCDEENASLATLDVRYRGDDEPSVTVVSTKGGTGGTLFEGTVANEDVFTLDGSDVTRSGNNGNGNGNGGGQTDRLGPEVEIRVEGGATTPIHVSCSEPLTVGMRFGSDGEFEIAGGTTTDGRPICGTEASL